MYKHSLDRKNVPAKGGIKSEGADQFYISKHICQITILTITSCTRELQNTDSIQCIVS